MNTENSHHADKVYGMMGDPSRLEIQEAYCITGSHVVSTERYAHMIDDELKRDDASNTS
jgi:hypothetical protein